MRAHSVWASVGVPRYARPRFSRIPCGRLPHSLWASPGTILTTAYEGRPRHVATSTLYTAKIINNKNNKNDNDNSDNPFITPISLRYIQLRWQHYIYNEFDASAFVYNEVR